MPAQLLKQQYQLVKVSRHILFTYCETISPQHFNQNVDGFGRGSIHNLLRHVASTYIHWLANFGMGQNLPYTDTSLVLTLPDFHTIYKQVDECVDQFLNKFADDLNTDIDNTVPGSDFRLQASPLKLFTHVITHEYHHKGQILSMSRNLGYIPVDTDVIQ